MKQVSYFVFYTSLLAYELNAMGRVVAWQAQTDTTGVSVSLLALIVFSGMAYYLMSKITTSLSSFGKSFFLFYGCLLFITMIHGFSKGFERSASMLDYIIPLICFGVEYHASYDRDIKMLRKYILSFFFVSLLIAYFVYFQYVSSLFNTGYIDMIGTNISYYLLYATPLMCLVINRNQIKYILFLVAITIVLSSKRGETIAFFMGWGTYYYLLEKNAIKKGKRGIDRLIHFVVLSLLLLGIIYGIDTIFGGVVFNRILESISDEGSGRIDIFNEVWNLIISSDVYGQLFGHGYNAVKSITNLSAHNDLLEIIFDFGWVCLVFFILFIINGYCFAFMHPLREIRPVLGMSLTFMVFCMMVSVIIIRTDFLNLFALFWGAVSGIPPKQFILQKQ